MAVIGITGGIGSGKSVVSRILRCNGYEVYDCDSEAKRIMISDALLKESLIKGIGPEIYQSDGSLNKPLLSHLLYSDDKVRIFVNNQVHAAVRRDIMDKKKGIKDFFIESAILATGGIVPFCDKIWIVTASDKLRIERVKKRDSLTEKEIEKRISAQKEELSLLPHQKSIFVENNDNSPLLTRIFSVLSEEYNDKEEFRISWNLEEILIDNQ